MEAANLGQEQPEQRQPEVTSQVGLGPGGPHERRSLLPQKLQSSGRQARLTLKQQLPSSVVRRRAERGWVLGTRIRVEEGGGSYYITMVCSLGEAVLSGLGILGLMIALFSWRHHRGRVSGFRAVPTHLRFFSPSSLEEVRDLRVIKITNGQESGILRRGL